MNSAWGSWEFPRPCGTPSICSKIRLHPFGLKERGVSNAPPGRGVGRSLNLFVAACALFACSGRSAVAHTAIPFVVRDLFSLPALAPGNYQPSAVVEFNGFAYFAATSSVNGSELWRTDGTTGG